MRYHDVEIPDERIAEVCRRLGAARLSLFGSVLTEAFGPESDVDVLVEFFPGRTPSLFRFAGMQLDLRDVLGGRRRVDLRTPEDLSRHLRDDVVAEAELPYAA